MVMMIIGLTRYSFQYHVAHREVLISVSVANNNNNITINIAHSNLETGRVATPGGRFTHSRRAQLFNRICQVELIQSARPSLIHDALGPLDPPTQTASFSIETDVFQQYTIVTNGQTDRPTDRTDTEPGRYQ